MISVFNGTSSLSADDFSSQDNLDDPEAGGWDATLTGEEEEEFFELQIVKQHEGEVSKVELGKIRYKVVSQTSFQSFKIISKVII